MKLTRIKGVPDSSQAKPGMAFFSGSGPAGKTCGDCRLLRYMCSSKDRRYDGQQLCFDGEKWIVGKHWYPGCAAYHRLAGRPGPAIKSAYRACKYFEQKPERPASDPEQFDCQCGVAGAIKEGERWFCYRHAPFSDIPKETHSVIRRLLCDLPDGQVMLEKAIAEVDNAINFSWHRDPAWMIGQHYLALLPRTLWHLVSVAERFRHDVGVLINDLNQLANTPVEEPGYVDPLWASLECLPRAEQVQRLQLHGPTSDEIDAFLKRYDAMGEEQHEPAEPSGGTNG